MLLLSLAILAFTVGFAAGICFVEKADTWCKEDNDDDWEQM